MSDLYWQFITGQVGVVMGGWAQGLVGNVVVFNSFNQSTLVGMRLAGEGAGAPGPVAKKGIFSFEYRPRVPAPYPPYTPYLSGVELKINTPTALGYNILNYEYRMAATELFAELFQYDVTLEEGAASCSPADGDDVVPGSAVTIAALPETDYTISSVTLNGTEVGNNYTFTPLEQAYTIVVTAVPATVPVTVDISYTKTDCLPRTSIEYRGLDDNGQPQSDGISVTMGGTVYASGLTPTVCASETPVSAPAVDVDVGSPFGVWAVAHDVRTRLVSLTVNGNDYVANPSGGTLPNQFVYCGNGVAGRPLNSGGLFFDVPGEAISISAVFASDYVCVSRIPQLPKGGDPDPDPWNPDPEEPLGKYRLSILPSPANAGVATGSGLYPANSAASITAAPNDGWSFIGFYGDYSGSTSPASVTMNADKRIIAMFKKTVDDDEYTLTVSCSPPEGGTTTGSGTFALNAVAPFSVTPDTGWSFSQWAGDASGSTNPDSIVMDEDKVVVALLNRPSTGGGDQTLVTLRVVVLPTPAAGIVTGRGTYTRGTVVSCTETPLAGFTFVKWYGDAAGTGSSVDVTMSADKLVYALFSSSSIVTTPVVPIGPFGEPETPKKIDWLGDGSPRGLIIRWRNDAGKWSKEHVIDLGTVGQTNLFKQICPMGEYTTRQWEIIHIDAIPFAVVYLEEEVEKRNE